MSVKQKINQWIVPAIHNMQAYHVSDSTGMVKLDAMENPYPLPDDIHQQFLSIFKKAELNRYPDSEMLHLKQSLQQVFSIPSDLGILIGNGSDEIIQILIMATAKSGAVVLAPEPSFVMYRVLTEALGLKYVGVPLTDDFSLDREVMLEAIERHNPAIIFLAYPNNPTGNLFDIKTVSQIIQSSQGLVVIDEAYQIFSSQTCLDLVKHHENVLLMRTLSKVGLAGLRFGYLVGGPEWLEEFNKIRLPYNINCLTQASIEFFLQHYAVFEQQAVKIKQGREQLFNELQLLKELEVFPSEANFLLFRSLKMPADSIFDHLLQQKILIKKFPPSPALLSNCLRVTVGTAAETSQFITELKNII